MTEEAREAHREYEFTMRRQVPFMDKYQEGLAHSEADFRRAHPFQPAEVSTLLPGPQHRLSAHSKRPFLDRVQRWKSRRANRLRKQIQEKDNEVMSECTFQPMISNFQLSEAHGSGYRRSHAEGRRRLMVQRIQRQRELDAECTFQPNLSTSATVSARTTPAPHRTSRHQRDNTPAANREAAQLVNRLSKPRRAKRKSDDPECTFRPRINDRYFRENQAPTSNTFYLRKNAFDRLSQSRRPSVASTPVAQKASSRAKRRGSEVIRSRSTGRMIPNGAGAGTGSSEPNFGTPAPSSSRNRNRSRRPASAISSRQRRQGLPSSSTDSETSSAPLNAFLRRNAERDSLRRKRLAALRSSMEPAHRPRINRKSRQLLKTNAGFLDRMQLRLQQQRDSKVTKRQSQAASHSFQPKINARSQRRARRTPEEMYEDFSRAQERLKMKREEQTERENQQLTFKPNITSKARKMAEGRDSDDVRRGIMNSIPQGRTGFRNPDAYMERIRRQQRARKLKERRAMREKTEEEMEECTFRPRTKKAPRYVRQIAASYASSKAAARRRKQEEEESRPKPFRF